MIQKNKKILVTGSSGFIGTNLVNHLLNADLDVVGIDIVKPQYEMKNENFHSYPLHQTILNIYTSSKVNICCLTLSD